MDTDCSVKFATEIHVYIFSLLLLSFTGQMECTAVPAQDSEFTAQTNEGFNPHFNALPSSQRSCNAKETIKRQIAVIRNTISCHKNK